LLHYSMIVLMIFGSIAVGVVLGYILREGVSRKRLESSKKLSERIIGESKKEAETIKKESVLQAKENLLKAKAEFDKDTRDRNIELDNLEKKIRFKEENLDKRMELLSQKEANLENRDKTIISRETLINKKHSELDGIIDEQRRRLEKIAGISSEEAKKISYSIHGR